MADVDVSIFDSVSVQEDISFFWDTLAPSVYDEVGISESVNGLYYFEISVNEAVSVVEYNVLYAPLHFNIDPRDEYRMMLPVWELDADFHKVFYCGDSLKAPGYSILAHCGAILDERMPTHSLTSGVVLQDYSFLGEQNIPVHSIAGYFGGMLNEKLAVRTAVLEFAFADVFVLDEEISPWTLAASFLYPDLFTLNQQTVVWEITEGDLVLSEMGITLDVRLPFYSLSGSMSLQDYMELSKRIPVWGLDSSMFTGDFNLAGNIPVWIIESVKDASVIEESRFTDYVLRYIRP